MRSPRQVQATATSRIQEVAAKGHEPVLTWVRVGMGQGVRVLEHPHAIGEVDAVAPPIGRGLGRVPFKLHGSMYVRTCSVASGGGHAAGRLR